MNLQNILGLQKSLFHLYISSNKLSSGSLFGLVEQDITPDANRAGELGVHLKKDIKNMEKNRVCPVERA